MCVCLYTVRMCCMRVSCVVVHANLCEHSPRRWLEHNRQYPFQSGEVGGVLRRWINVVGDAASSNSKVEVFQRQDEITLHQ